MADPDLKRHRSAFAFHRQQLADAVEFGFRQIVEFAGCAARIDAVDPERNERIEFLLQELPIDAISFIDGQQKSGPVAANLFPMQGLHFLFLLVRLFFTLIFRLE
jgi:hypothetical protein